MLPVHAGGGSTALEDAAALGVLFNGIPFNDAVTINSRLMLYNALRLPRDATQQILSAVMFNPQPASSLRSRIEQFCTVKLPEVALGGWSKPTCEFLCGYDVFRETQKAVDWAEQRAWKNMERLPDGLVQHFGELQA